LAHDEIESFAVAEFREFRNSHSRQLASDYGKVDIIRTSDLLQVKVHMAFLAKLLQDIPKPPAERTVQKVDESKDRSCPQDEVPQTPMTPMSPSTVMLLHNFIIQKQAHAPDKTSNQSLERYVQKLTKAAQTFFTQCVLQRKQIQFLTKMNDESKVRRSTKSEVLRKAKVMSYEDLKDEREKREKKVATKNAKGKGKRGPKPKKTTSAEKASVDEGTRLRKRKNPPEADPPEASSPEPKAKKVRMSKASEPWKAPVARMSEVQVEEDGIDV